MKSRRRMRLLINQTLLFVPASRNIIFDGNKKCLVASRTQHYHLRESFCLRNQLFEKVLAQSFTLALPRAKLISATEEGGLSNDTQILMDLLTSSAS
jgi:hypothetical protein